MDGKKHMLRGFAVLTLLMAAVLGRPVAASGRYSSVRSQSG